MVGNGASRQLPDIYLSSLFFLSLCIIFVSSSANRCIINVFVRGRFWVSWANGWSLCACLSHYVIEMEQLLTTTYDYSGIGWAAMVPLTGVRARCSRWISPCKWCFRKFIHRIVTKFKATSVKNSISLTWERGNFIGLEIITLNFCSYFHIC